MLLLLLLLLMLMLMLIMIMIMMMMMIRVVLLTKKPNVCIFVSLTNQAYVNHFQIHSITTSIINTYHNTNNAATDLLITLINQVLATFPPSSLPLSLFNFSYIDTTPPPPPQTTTSPSTNSDVITSSSLILAIQTVPCDDYGTAILLTTLLDRFTSYSLLSSHLLIPSQFVKLPYGDNHYCTFLITKQRLVTMQSSIITTIYKTSTTPTQDMSSRCVSSEDANIYQYSFSSPVNIGVIIILTMTILPTILIIILIILPMMLLMLPAVIGTHKDLRLLLPLLPPSSYQVKEKSFVYNNSSFGFCSKITLLPYQ